MRRGGRYRIATVTAAFLLLAGLWWLVWPAQMGGTTTYVTTHGTSMEPRFHTGDLAVLRPAATYRVGDVAAYHSDQLHTVVMHRIVAIQNGRYTFKGDNNSWLDPGEATIDQLIGTLVLRVPQGGAWLKNLTGPPALGIMASALILAGGSTMTRHRRKDRRRRPAMSRHNSTTAPKPLGALKGLPPRMRAAGALTLAVGLLGLGLGLPAWTGPLTSPSAVPKAGPATMVFSYTATVAPSPAYDGTTVTSPDPVFRRLTDKLEVHYTYRGSPGTLSVNAELSSPSGWHSNLPLVPATRFTGTGYEGSVPLDLKALDTRAQAAAAVTGIPAGPLTVTLTANVQNTTGAVFRPSLKLNLNPLQLTLAGNPSDLSITDTGTPARSAASPRTMGVGKWNITATAARILSIALLAACLLSAALLALVQRRSPAANEARTIRSRYSSILVRVQPMPPAPGRPVIDLTTFSALAKLAERYGLLVLHWTRSGIETFIVQDENTTYRYRTGTGTTEPRHPAADQNTGTHIAGL